MKVDRLAPSGHDSLEGTETVAKQPLPDGGRHHRGEQPDNGGEQVSSSHIEQQIVGTIPGILDADKYDGENHIEDDGGYENQDKNQRSNGALRHKGRTAGRTGCVRHGGNKENYPINVSRVIVICYYKFRLYINKYPRTLLVTPQSRVM